MGFLRAGHGPVHHVRVDDLHIAAPVPHIPIVERLGQHERRLEPAVPVLRDSLAGRDPQQRCGIAAGVTPQGLR